MPVRIRSLRAYLREQTEGRCATFSDGAPMDAVRFPLAAVETEGAILFADLPGYSQLARVVSPSECAYIVSNFFAWFEGEGASQYGGIVDKYIGDEVMLVFLADVCTCSALEAAMRTAEAMIAHDPFAFEPKVGIAAGEFSVALVGTLSYSTTTAIGHTVNVAARCTQSAGPRSVRVAASELDMASSVFQPDGWTIVGPTEVQLKNLDPLLVVDAARTSQWVPAFDGQELVREGVAFARREGAVVRARRSGM